MQYIMGRSFQGLLAPSLALQTASEADPAAFKTFLAALEAIPTPSNTIVLLYCIEAVIGLMD